MILTGKVLQEYEQFPRGYGVSYYDFTRRLVICHPIPFNLLIGLWRHIHIRLSQGLRDRIQEEHQSDLNFARGDSFKDGYMDGYKEGYKDGYMDGHS